MRKFLTLSPTVFLLFCNEMFAIEGKLVANNEEGQSTTQVVNDAKNHSSEGDAVQNATHTSAHSHTHASHTSAHSHTHATHTSAHSHTHAPHTSAHSHTHAPHTSTHSHAHAPHTSAHAHAHAPHTSAHAHTHAHTSAHSHTPAHSNENAYEFPFDFSDQLFADIASSFVKPSSEHASGVSSGDLLEPAAPASVDGPAEGQPVPLMAPERSPAERSINASRFVSDYDNYVPTLAQLQECQAFSIVCRFSMGQATIAELIAAASHINWHFDPKTHSCDVIWKFGLQDGEYFDHKYFDRFHKTGLCVMHKCTTNLSQADRIIVHEFELHTHLALRSRLHKAQLRNLEGKLRAKSGIYLNRFSRDNRVLTPLDVLQCGIVAHCCNGRASRSLRRADEFLSALVNDEGNYTPLGLQIPPNLRVFALYHRALVLFEANQSDINMYHRFALNKYHRVETIASKIIDDNGALSSEAQLLTPRQLSLMAYVRGISLFYRHKFAAADPVLALFIDDTGENGPLATALPKRDRYDVALKPKWGDAVHKRGIALVNLRKDAAAANVLGRLIATHNQEIAAGEREPEITRWYADATFMMGVALGNLHRCLDAAHVLFQLIKASGDESALAKCLPLYTRSKARFLLGESLHHLAVTSEGEVTYFDNNAAMTIPLNNALMAVLSRFLSLDYIDDTEDMSHLKSKRQRGLVRQYLGSAMSRNLDFVGSAAVLSKLINDDGNCDALMAITHDNAIRSNVIFGRVNSLMLSDVNTAARVSMGFFNEYGNLQGNIYDSLSIDNRMQLRRLCMWGMKLARKEIGEEQKTKALNIASKFFEGEEINVTTCPQWFQDIGLCANLTFLYASLRNHYCGYGDLLLNRLFAKFRKDRYSWDTLMFNALPLEYQQELKNMGTTPMI